MSLRLTKQRVVMFNVLWVVGILILFGSSPSIPFIPWPLWALLLLVATGSVVLIYAVNCTDSSLESRQWNWLGIVGSPVDFLFAISLGILLGPAVELIMRLFGKR